MSKTLLDLAEDLEIYASKLDEKASEIAVETALVILGQLVQVTPVDTSKAISNWQVSLNEPVQSSVLPFYLGKGGSTKKGSASATVKDAKSILRNKKPNDIIYLSNVLPYINRLNEGYSKQAPAGFVERAVLIGKLQIAKRKV